MKNFAETIVKNRKKIVVAAAMAGGAALAWKFRSVFKNRFESSEADDAMIELHENEFEAQAEEK